jgi:hypothetical protein
MEVQDLLVLLILDGKLNARIDQVNSLVEIWQSDSGVKLHDGFVKLADNINDLYTVILSRG